MRRGVLLFALFLLLSVWLACGGGSSSDTGNLRFVQGSPDAPMVNFVVDGKTEQTNMLYGNATDYISLKVGSRHAQVIPVNSTTPLLDDTVSMDSGVFQTLILTGPAAQLKPVLLTDSVASTSTTPVKNVRVINISTQMGPADVYIVAPGVNLASVTPVATNLSLGENTDYQPITTLSGGNAGNYEVFMTVPGTRNAFLATGPLAVATAKNQTVVIEDAAGGGFTFAALQDQ